MCIQITRALQFLRRLRSTPVWPSVRRHWPFPAKSRLARRLSWTSLRVPPPFRTHDDRGCSPHDALARFAWRQRTSLPAAAPPLGFLAPSTVFADGKSPSHIIAPGHVAARSRIRGSHDFGTSTPRHSSEGISARELCCLSKESDGSSGCPPSHASHPSKTHSSSTAVPPHDGLGPPAVHRIVLKAPFEKGSFTTTANAEPACSLLAFRHGSFQTGRLEQWASTTSEHFLSLQHHDPIRMGKPMRRRFLHRSPPLGGLLTKEPMRPLDAADRAGHRHLSCRVAPE